MDASYDGDVVRAGRGAREQFYDARGYGRPVDGDVHLAPVEAAHLLFRGDLDAVVDDSRDGDGSRLDFRAFLASAAVSEVDFFVYKDLRDRGFYLSPAGDGRGGGNRTGPGEGTPAGAFVVYPRGKGPWDGTVAYRVEAVSERAAVPAADLSALAGRGTDETRDPGDADSIRDAGVLAVVDEESETTYFAVDSPAATGSTDHDIPATGGDLVADRVLVWDAPDALHRRAFYGQRLDDGAVQLSLVEAAYLAGRGTLSVAGVDDGEQAVVERGRAVEGERFDRRLQVYAALRGAGVVPKTGYKFGADFRTYADVDSVDDLGHSERLVRVLPPDHVFAPRDIALDVRLAHGVRKEMVFALTGASVEWLSLGRLTP
jgi:tRNA-intron endonuclease